MGVNGLTLEVESLEVGLSAHWRCCSLHPTDPPAKSAYLQTGCTPRAAAGGGGAASTPGAARAVFGSRQRRGEGEGGATCPARWWEGARGREAWTAGRGAGRSLTWLAGRGWWCLLSGAVFRVLGESEALQLSCAIHRRPENNIP